MSVSSRKSTFFIGIAERMDLCQESGHQNNEKMV